MVLHRPSEPARITGNLGTGTNFAGRSVSRDLCDHLRIADDPLGTRSGISLRGSERLQVDIVLQGIAEGAHYRNSFAREIIEILYPDECVLTVGDGVASLKKKQ